MEVSCLVRNNDGPDVLFLVAAQHMLDALASMPHVGNDDHPNRLELEAQRALLRHAIQHGNRFRLHDDQWGRTGIALLNLFERGRARMRVDEKEYRFSDLTKEDWSEGTEPMMKAGGFLYLDKQREVIYKQQTWIS